MLKSTGPTVLCNCLCSELKLPPEQVSSLPTEAPSFGPQRSARAGGQTPAAILLCVRSEKIINPHTCMTTYSEGTKLFFQSLNLLY